MDLFYQKKINQGHDTNLMGKTQNKKAQNKHYAPCVAKDFS